MPTNKLLTRKSSCIDSMEITVAIDLLYYFVTSFNDSYLIDFCLSVSSNLTNWYFFQSYDKKSKNSILFFKNVSTKISNNLIVNTMD